MQVCVSQQEQEATSLVTLTPTSGPCFIYEAKLNNFPLFVHKHTWTDCNTNKRLVMTRPLKNLQASTATKLGEEECQCGFPPQNQTSARAEWKGATVSRQWAQNHLWPPWLWHLAGCCNLSASRPDSHTHNRGTVMRLIIIRANSGESDNCVHGDRHHLKLCFLLKTQREIHRHNRASCVQ